MIDLDSLDKAYLWSSAFLLAGMLIAATVGVFLT